MNEPATSTEPRATREAAGTLIAQLSPQERAAVVLKDAFGLSLEEIAEALSTTIGAIKTALHRGRSKLVAPEPEEATVTPAVLDAFCEAFNARDLDSFDSAASRYDDARVPRFPGFEHGADVIKRGTLQGTLFGCPDEDHGAAAPPAL